ncbi:hypothetical protein L596_029052 [Steinernema carpocapsae]|uniref:Uncharacterized protein n=1 Tax=Steinernema carpocapsae TaxID=34508 RepID=A0A4U5LTH9_STECR|nr:hypothetical protein L596_029052 [Steinernema carpocapsae]
MTLMRLATSIYLLSYAAQFKTDAYALQDIGQNMMDAICLACWLEGFYRAENASQKSAKRQKSFQKDHGRRALVPENREDRRGGLRPLRWA